VEEVCNAKEVRSVWTIREVVHEGGIRVAVGPQGVALGVCGDEGVPVVLDGKELGVMTTFGAKRERNGNGGGSGKQESRDERDAPAERRSRKTVTWSLRGLSRTDAGMRGNHRLG